MHSVARTRPTGPAHVRTGIGVGPAAGLDESRAAGAARSAVEGHARAGRTPTHTRRGADARAVDGDRNSKRMTPGRGSRFGPIPRRSRAHGRVDPVPQSPVPLLCAAAVAPWRMSGAPGTGPWAWRRPAALLLDARSSLPLRTTRASVTRGRDSPTRVLNDLAAGCTPTDTACTRPHWIQSTSGTSNVGPTRAESSTSRWTRILCSRSKRSRGSRVTVTARPQPGRSGRAPQFGR